MDRQKDRKIDRWIDSREMYFVVVDVVVVVVKGARDGARRG